MSCCWCNICLKGSCVGHREVALEVREVALEVSIYAHEDGHGEYVLSGLVTVPFCLKTVFFSRGIL